MLRCAHVCFCWELSKRLTIAKILQCTQDEEPCSHIQAVPVIDMFCQLNPPPLNEHCCNIVNDHERHSEMTPELRITAIWQCVSSISPQDRGTGSNNCNPWSCWRNDQTHLPNAYATELRHPLHHQQNRLRQSPFALHQRISPWIYPWYIFRLITWRGWDRTSIII